MRGERPILQECEVLAKDHVAKTDGFSPLIELSSPEIGTFDFVYYSRLKKMVHKLRTCGQNEIEFMNSETGEELKITMYCDNRVCTDPNCQEHRLYKFMREHRSQIAQVQNSIKHSHRTPRGYVFSDGRYPYPISREYCQNRFKELYRLLQKRSKTEFSVHMEIKTKPADNEYPYETWYLHFHVVSGYVELRGINTAWGAVVRYETAIIPSHIAYYVAKYASKTPTFPSQTAFFEFANTVYKLQMHRFSVGNNGNSKLSVWVLSNISYSKRSYTYGELVRYLVKYAQNATLLDRG